MSRGCEQHGLHATSLEAERCARREATDAEGVATGDRVRVTFDGVAVLVDEHGVHEVAVYDDLSGVIQLEASQVTVTRLPAEAGERVLFAGGPKHGQVLDLHDDPKYVCAMEATTVDGEVLATQVYYQRTTVVIDVDGRRYARPVFIDSRLWSGVAPVPAPVREKVNDAVVRQWMAAGRDVTPDPPYPG